MLSLRSLSNRRRWFSAMMLVADARHDHGLAVGRRALGEEDQRRDNAERHQATEVVVDVGLVDQSAH